MGNPFLDAIGDVGYAMDTPGAYLRGALSGKLGERASGQDMLGSWGVDAGPLGGMAAEMVLDPLMLAGLAGGAVKGLQGINAATRGARAMAGLGEAAPLARRLAELKGGVETPLDAVRFASRQGESSNPIARGIAGFVGDETGAVRPFQEIGRRSDPDIVNARDWYHGTNTSALTPETLDPLRSHPNGMLGQAVYLAGDPEYAQVYTHGPQPTIYKTNTDLSGIADVDLPTTPGIAGGMRDLLAAGTHADDLKSLDKQFRYYDDLPLWDYLQTYFRKRSAAGDPQALTRLLRGEGVDALIQTEGKNSSMRAMQQYVDGGNPVNQTLAMLDPNDTISRVGRANQITRFEPQQIEDLMRQIRGG